VTDEARHAAAKRQNPRNDAENQGLVDTFKAVVRPTGGIRPSGTLIRSDGIPSLEDEMADKSITKTELVASIASATGQSQAAVSGVLDALFATVSDAVAKGSKVSIPGWISFEQVATAARTGRNPQTGAEIKIPAGKRVKVTAGSKLKAAVK
jgi:DNA-binding protein HU-beta